ncbi:MAG: molybdenum cofactor biosynthesis protein [Anaerolineales bacterium]
MTNTKIEILFFANLREIVGAKKIELEIGSDSSVADLKKKVVKLYPALEQHMETILVSVNKEYGFDEETIPEGAEVAFFPPVSGGSDLPSVPPTVLLIQEGGIDLDQLVDQITTPRTGAACVFTGMVRAITEQQVPHRTQYLEYQAYQEMAETQLQKVADEIRSRWPSVEGIAIVQRVGHLEAGTPTVAIACSAGHRDSGVFEAARYGIDRLKQIVPIWKKEVGPDGEEWIEGDYIPKRDG